jgi:hypothetical protein
MFEQVPDEVWKDLEYEVRREDLDYADNYRAYRYKDRLHFDDFVKAEKNGCCGTFSSHTTVNGDKWIISCNYGH